MKRPETMSFARDWQPKPIATVPMPATAAREVAGTPRYTRILKIAMNVFRNGAEGLRFFGFHVHSGKAGFTFRHTVQHFLGDFVEQVAGEDDDGAHDGFLQAV